LITFLSGAEFLAHEDHPLSGPKALFIDFHLSPFHLLSFIKNRRRNLCYLTQDLVKKCESPKTVGRPIGEGYAVDPH
jgi:hypothetical protein